MTDQNDSEQTRRTFVKGAAATGAAATGITAFSGSAAAQDAIEIQDAVVQQQAGLINVAVAVQDVIDDIVVRIRNVRVIRDVEVEVGDVQVITIDLEDVNIQALQNINVIVQALSGGRVVQTARQQARIEE